MISFMIYAFLMIWVKSNALIQWWIDQGDQTILRIQKLHKKYINWNPLEGYQLQKKDAFTKKQAIKGSKKNNWAQEDIMIRSTKCSKNQEGTPQGTCTMKRFVFQYGVHNMESSLPPRCFRTQKGARLYS